MNYSFFHPYGPTSSRKVVPVYLQNIKPKVVVLENLLKRNAKSKRLVKSKEELITIIIFFILNK